VLVAAFKDASDNAGKPRRFGVSNAIELVNTGTAPNAGNGDTLYAAFTKDMATPPFPEYVPGWHRHRQEQWRRAERHVNAVFGDIVALWSGVVPAATSS